MERPVAPRINLRLIAPNLVTSLGMSLGVLAIFRALGGETSEAAWLIVLCVLIDKLDGFVARRLDAQSEFGMQLDSLSDLVTFGVAPAVLLVTLMGEQSSTLERVLSWGAAAAYVVAAALRLARFNVTTEDLGESIFLGFPTTMCGGIVSTGALTITAHDLLPSVSAVLPLIMLALAVTMISDIPIPKIHARKNRALNAFQLIGMAAIFIFGALRLYPEFLLAMTLIYVVFGSGYYLLPSRRS